MISGALEAKVVLSAGQDLAPLLEQYKSWLPGLFIVSQVELAASGARRCAEIGIAARTDRRGAARRRRKVRALLELFDARRRKRRLPDRVRALREGARRNRRVRRAGGRGRVRMSGTPARAGCGCRSLCWPRTAPRNSPSSVTRRRSSAIPLFRTSSSWSTIRIRASRSACFPIRVRHGSRRSCCKFGGGDGSAGLAACDGPRGRRARAMRARADSRRRGRQRARPGDPRRRHRFSGSPPGKYIWPAFNVADSAITIGAVLVLFELLFGGASSADSNRRKTAMDFSSTGFSLWVFECETNVTAPNHQDIEHADQKSTG